MKKVILFLLFSLSLYSCSDNEQYIPKQDVTDLSANRNSEFAKGLALALKDPQIRNFIKKESLKQVDKDFDVIYALVKNYKVEDERTFQEALSGYFGGCDNLESITSLDPTLTIFVPTLRGVFSAEDWDVENQLPVVAYAKTGINKQDTELQTFNSDGESFYIQRYKYPTTPTIVVKSNERLVNPKSTQKSLLKSTDSNNSLLSDNGDLIAYFLDEEFINKENDEIISKAGLEDIPVYDYASDNIYFKAKKHCYESPRDYIYYGISTLDNITKGQLNTNYRECITSITFNNYQVWSHVNDINDKSANADWIDGNLEVKFDFLFLTKEEAISTIDKMFSISVNDLFNHDSQSTYTYYFPKPVEVFNWDMYKYGNTFKVVVSEYDDGTTTEINQSISTTISNNWEVSTSGGFGKIWKVGAKYNGGHSETKGKSTKINSTNNSDLLGSVFVDFFNPIYKGEYITLLATMRYRRKNSLGGYKRRFIHRSFHHTDIDGMNKWIQNIRNNQELIGSNIPSRIKSITIDLVEGEIHQANTGMVSLSIIPMKIN